ncbi:MAG TPA: ABC transporter permease, partial [Pilimelia sp.]|nr:ABC transporter permease [Pilimelia sp.]
ALTGLVAGVVGVLAAAALAQLVVAGLGASGTEVARPGFPLDSAIAVVLGAVLVTLAAVTAPAASAARVSPLEALRTAQVADGRRGIGFLRLAAGALLALAAGGIAGLVFAAAPDPAGPSADYDLERQLMLTILSGTLAFGALLALGPVLLPPLLWLVSWPIRRGGPVGRLAVGGIGGAPRRAAAVSAVVALGITLIAGTLVGSASLRSLADAELASSYPADIEVAGTGDRALPAGLAERLRGHPEIARVVPYRGRDVTVESPSTSAMANTVQLRATDLDPRALPATRRLGVAEGSLDAAGPGQVVLDLSVADILGVRAGDSLRLVLGSRRVDVRVAATLSGSTPLGSLLADASDFDGLGLPRPPSGVLVDAAGSGESAVASAQAAVRAELGTTPGIQVDVLADAREETRGWLAALTVAALGLLGLTVLIGAVGVGTTTALSVVERVRESGLLRAVGLSRGGLWTMLTTEAGLYGLLGSAIGLALGVPYAWLAVRALGMNVPLLFPVVELAVVVVVVTALTAVAGLMPARRAARVSPVAALGIE